MTITAVQAAALDHLATVTGRPDTVWPNMAKIATTPRLEVYEGPVAARQITFGGMSDAKLMLQVDVVVKAGTETTEMRTVVQRVLDAFPIDQQIGDARISGPAVPGAYRQDNTEYRCSITIPFRTLL